MKKYIENTTNSPLYVGGLMIPPGEGYMVDVPNEPLDCVAPEIETLAEKVADLLKSKVADIVKGLPELNGDALAMMSALENQAAKPRASLLVAIADAQIALADAKLTSDDLSDEADEAEKAADKASE